MSRIFKALARQGLHVTHDSFVYRVRRSDGDGIEAEVLLPPGFPLEAKALHQLMAFASVEGVEAACATPDFHPGDVVPVGAVVKTSKDVVIPQAIGTDINCGMRLHVADVPLDVFMAQKDEVVRRLRGDLLLGTRDLPMTRNMMIGMFRAGAIGWAEQVARGALGQLTRSDMGQVLAEADRVYDQGSYDGSEKYVPEDLVPTELIRDGSLATIGGGNHFVEFQVVDEVLSRGDAFRLGVREGQIAVMVHTGSRAVGVHVGRAWVDKARELWPSGVRYPSSGIFPLRGDAAQEYLCAMQTAANYSFVNRLLLAELVRLRMREVLGGDLEMPLVFDLPHNVIFCEHGCNVHRKGATPAHAEQPVIIPGSMGHPSYLLKGLGSEKFLSSASHGAGRASRRGQMLNRGDLGLEGIECITLREERLIEEAPAAYKDIGPVVDIQVQAGIAEPVARMRPLLTFKA